MDNLICTADGCTDDGEITSFDFVLCDRHRKELAVDLDNDYKKQLSEQGLTLPIKDTDRVMEQITSYLNSLKHDLYMCPYLCFKDRWELKAQIRSVESILVVIERKVSRNNK